MSNKFTGITSGGQFIPVYDKDTHSALSGKQDKLSAGNNIQIENNVISVTGEMGKVYSGEGGVTVDNINDKISLDASAQSAIEAFKGEFDLSAGTNISFRTEGQTVYIDSDAAPLPEYVTEAANYVSAQSGTWDTVTAKADTTALNAYQTIEGMSAYQPSGDYQPAGSYLSANALDSVSGNWNEVSAKLDTTAFSDVSGSFLTSVPDTYLQNTDLTTSDGKITAISGIPLSAGGGEVPEGVMVESAVGFNAVNEISGYNGSAIAQYGAEKQWLVHDDTLVHAANSAQYALGVNLSAVAQLLGVDETVLWSGSLASGDNATLNEPLSAFENVKIHWRDWDSQSSIHINEFPTSNTYYSMCDSWYGSPGTILLFRLNLSSDRNLQVSFNNALFQSTTGTAYNSATQTRITKIVGIGRKQ